MESVDGYLNWPSDGKLFREIRAPCVFAESCRAREYTSLHAKCRRKILTLLKVALLKISSDDEAMPFQRGLLFRLAIKIQVHKHAEGLKR